MIDTTKIELEKRICKLEAQLEAKQEMLLILRELLTKAYNASVPIFATNTTTTPWINMDPHTFVVDTQTVCVGFDKSNQILTNDRYWVDQSTLTTS